MVVFIVLKNESYIVKFERINFIRQKDSRVTINVATGEVETFELTSNLVIPVNKNLNVDYLTTEAAMTALREFYKACLANKGAFSFKADEEETGEKKNNV